MSFAMTVLFYMKKREIRCAQGKIDIIFLLIVVPYKQAGFEGCEYGNRQGCRCAAG